MPDITGTALLSVTQGVASFGAFLPKISEVRRADPANNPDVAADVRMGEVAAATLTLGIGAIASSLTGSMVPAVTALLMAIILISLYESTLRTYKPFEPKKPRLVPEPEVSNA